MYLLEPMCQRNIFVFMLCILMNNKDVFDYLIGFEDVPLVEFMYLVEKFAFWLVIYTCFYVNETESKFLYIETIKLYCIVLYCIYMHAGESYRRRLRSLLLYLCYVFRAVINTFVCSCCN